ncbi:cytochrome c oxidase assembly protein [Saccharopolyspora karakumensis]|uniref:cytochrome c oxidase assembly protein n=1 Tax=Saccharopolyspora karakumensis TaxID=2530386 RepID=UPI001A9D3B57|nr:cytochrome c oxidase assembly protein [Saccharopolyspora karakumensis]
MAGIPLGVWAARWLCAAATSAGPFAQRAHHDFVLHMTGHILLGMLAPVLMVLAAPVTLALRALPVAAARTLARCTRSTPMRVLTQPAIAAMLNIGGLWVLYRTGVYAAMHTEPWLHAAVHIHVLAAGFVFTFAVLGGPDPAPHRSHAAWRATTLVVAVAAHNVLAKTVYAAPPDGVTAEQAQIGGQLMYYGSAPVELLLFVLLCRSWITPGRLLPHTDLIGRS